MAGSSVVGNSFFGIDITKLKNTLRNLRRRCSKRILLIDFGITSISLAELQIARSSIALRHVKRYPLPEEALERGIPSDPVQMALLIRAHCIEERIRAHRAAVSIPADAVFTNLVEIPKSIENEDVISYLLEPSCSVQIPIQLDNMDLELIPLSIPSSRPDCNVYFLTAVPRKITDQLISTVNLADMELLRLQTATAAQLNQTDEQMRALSSRELIIHLEFLKECTQVTLITSKGPLKITRLTAIREFPEPVLVTDSSSQVTQPTSEREIVANDGYLSLSELDIRRLVIELKTLMKDVEEQFPWLLWRILLLAGPGSSHPALAQLLEHAIGLPVQECRALAAPGLAELNLAQPILAQNLGRLVGLGLSFSRESLISDGFEEEEASLNIEDQLTTPFASLATLKSDDSTDFDPGRPQVSLNQAVLPEADASDTPSSSIVLSIGLNASLREGLILGRQEDQEDSTSQTTDSNQDVGSPDFKYLSRDVILPSPLERALEQQPLESETSSKGLDDSSIPAHTAKQNAPLFSFSETADQASISESSMPSQQSDLESYPPLRSDESDLAKYSGTSKNYSATQAEASVESETIPFSMGDLLSSFQARQDHVIDIGSLSSDEIAEPEIDVHLIDDPSAWPTVAREPGSDSQAIEKDPNQDG